MGLFGRVISLVARRLSKQHKHKRKADRRPDEPTSPVYEWVKTFLALDCAASDRLEGLITEYILYKALDVQQVQLQYRIYLRLLQ